MIRWCRHRIKSFLRSRVGITDARWCLENLKDKGFRPDVIVDIGAYKGDWTRQTMEIFPDARFLMIEAQPDKEEALRRLGSEFPGSVDYAICLLGPQKRDSVQFFKIETGSSVLADLSNAPRNPIRLTMRTLDDLVDEKKIPTVSFLKLDVQGYELEVLRGAIATLRNVAVVLMEVSFVACNENGPLVHDVIEFMKDLGFLTYDICSLNRHDVHNILVQGDFLFVRKDSALRMPLSGS